MSASGLKEILQIKLQEKNMKVTELERRASLSMGAARRIIQGLIPNPTIETVIAIANVFNCSVDELIGKTITNKIDPKNLNIPKETIWNNNLMKYIFKETYNHIYQQDITTNLQTVISFIIETYNYCLFKKNGVFDKDFYEWYITQTFDNTQTANVTQLESVNKAS